MTIDETETPAIDPPVFSLEDADYKSAFKKSYTTSIKNGSWLLTFTDVTALMLTFFVLLFSMSTPTPQNWADLTASTENAYEKHYGAPAHGGVLDAENLRQQSTQPALDLPYLEQVIRDLIKRQNINLPIEIERTDEFLRLSIPDHLYFAPDQSVLSPQGQKALSFLNTLLPRIENQIKIIGYADPEYKSQNETQANIHNWSLALQRAQSAAAWLVKMGYQGKELTVEGHGSSFKKLNINKNSSDQALRRVDIMIYNIR
jgi:chemotaxis protein MotB